MLSSRRERNTQMGRFIYYSICIMFAMIVGLYCCWLTDLFGASHVAEAILRSIIPGGNIPGLEDLARGLLWLL
jgi:hypothetical protein